MRKRLRWAILVILVGALAGCGQSGLINVMSREDGSGTREAFVQVFNIEDEHGDDVTTLDAVVQNSTGSIMQTVGGDRNSIGYISVGSLDDTVKPLKIDGIEPTVDNISSGSYQVSRPFILAWPKDEQNPLIEDFLKFTHSKAGAAIIEAMKFVPLSADQANQVNDHGVVYQDQYESQGLSGTIEVAGSTSVTPVMEKLVEAYRALNPEVSINITSNGSSAGLETASNGAVDLGMSSRPLTESELSILAADSIALDGIVMIVNPDNPLDDISYEEVRQIFLGNLTEWSQLASHD